MMNLNFSSVLNAIFHTSPEIIVVKLIVYIENLQCLIYILCFSLLVAFSYCNSIVLNLRFERLFELL